MEPKHFVAALAVAFGGVGSGCDKMPGKEGGEAAPEEISEEADDGTIKFRAEAKPLKPGDQMTGTLKITNVVPTKPPAALRQAGVRRPIDVETIIDVTYTAHYVAQEGDSSTWRFDFEQYSSKVQKDEAAAESTYGLPGESVTASIGGADGPSVTTKSGEPATESQSKVGIALARAHRARVKWREFFSSRDFVQGEIVKAPVGLFLGDLIESEYGLVTKGATTMSLFRLGMEDEEEVAYMDVSSNARVDVDNSKYSEFEMQGKAVVRLSDGALLSYDVEAKVTPRASTGEMLPTGSGSWRAEYQLQSAKP